MRSPCRRKAVQNRVARRRSRFVFRCVRRGGTGGGLDDASARTFFEAHFRPCRVNPGDRSMGFVTGYYESVAVASRFKTDRFRYPVYRRPDDLIGLTDANRPEGFDPYFAFARQTSA